MATLALIGFGLLVVGPTAYSVVGGVLAIALAVGLGPDSLDMFARSLLLGLYFGAVWPAAFAFGGIELVRIAREEGH